MNLQSISNKVYTRSVYPVLSRVNNSTYGKRLVSGSFWTILGTIFSQGTTFVSTLLIANIFGQVFLGEYGLAKLTVMNLTLYTGLGIGMTTTKYISEFLLTDKIRAGRIIALSYVIAITLGALFSFGMFLFAPWISAAVLETPALESTIRLAALWLFFVAISAQQCGVLCGFQDFKSIAKTNIITGLLALPLLLGGGYIGNVWGIVFGSIIVTFINFLLNAYFIKKNKRKNNIYYDWKNCLHECRTLISFSVPIALSSLFVGNAMYLCNLLLKRQPDGISEIAIMIVCIQFYNISLYFANQTWRVFVTLLSEQFGTKNEKAFWKTVKTSLCVNAGSNISIAVLLILCSSQILGMFGKTFEHGYFTFITLMIAAFFTSLNGIPELVFQCRRQQWITLALACFWSVTAVSVTYFFLLHGLGSLGMALGILSAQIVQFFCSYLILIFLYKKNIVVRSN